MAIFNSYVCHNQRVQPVIYHLYLSYIPWLNTIYRWPMVNLYQLYTIHGISP